MYCVNASASTTGMTQSYTLINPYSLSANTFVAGSADTESNTFIESNTPISQESTGIYYTDLNPILYATDVTYDLVWYVQYTSSAPVKKLSTRFRLNNQTGPSGEISIEIVNNTIEIEIL